MNRKKAIRGLLIAMIAISLLTPAAFAGKADGDGWRLLRRAQSVLEALRGRDFEGLAAMAAEGGVIFSPYAYIEDSAVKLDAGRLAALNLDDEYAWGIYDGSGEPIDLTVSGYFDRFVYDKDYLNETSLIGINTLAQTGNTISNIDKAFPDARFIEFYVPGTNPDYSGMDWGSLRLVFQIEGGEFMLAGVIHDQWTV
jgi:hypothetical protein